MSVRPGEIAVDSHTDWIRLGSMCLAFQFHPIKVSQFGRGVDGLLGLETAHHSIHKKGIGQSLLHVLGVLRTQTTKSMCSL